MRFDALYFGDRLTMVNPQGVIGVVTLWSKPEYVLERFREAGVDLDPATSPIAVFGTLYGNGLREMLRNLLYNPQIQVLLICGHDRSGSYKELRNFFDLGTETMVTALVKYKIGPKCVDPLRILHTQKIIDPLVTREEFRSPPRLEFLGDPKKKESLEAIRTFFANYTPNTKRIPERVDIPLPAVEVEHFPSNPRGHQIIAEFPWEAWAELIFFITRFGRRVNLEKGERLELQNVKVVVENPREEEDAAHLLYLRVIDPGKLEKYYKEFLDGDLRPDEAYTYGHRLRTYFGIDAVENLANRLQKDPEDRKAYFTLWDNKRDLTAKESRPCFVSAFFRKFQEKLTLTATFRTHNALDAWLLNFFGLREFQKAVAGEVRMEQGAITVFSHSISIDPKELDRALMVVERREWKMHLDPMGYFRVTIDGDELLVEHRAEDVTLKEYRGRSAVSLQHQIARDAAVSDINHAMYLGRQLAKAEMALKEGREFVQD
jgi:thymidylate synthase